MVVNNRIDNPASAAIHYGLQLGEWGLHPWVAGQIAIVGNASSSRSATARARFPTASGRWAVIRTCRRRAARLMPASGTCPR